MKVDITYDNQYLVLSSDYIFELNVIRNAFTREIPNAWMLRKITSIRNTDRCFMNNYNMVPSGLWLELIKVAKENNIVLNMTEAAQAFLTKFQLDYDTFKKYVDETFADAVDEKGRPFQPYEYQIKAAYTLIRYRRCCGEISTSGGKTLISFIIFKYLIEVAGVKNMLYIVPSVDLATQSAEKYELYESFLKNHKHSWEIGILMSGLTKKQKEKVLSCNILFGTFQSLCRRDVEFFNKFTATLCDECVDKDTLITMSDNTKKKISDICIGDYVKSYNEKTKLIEDHRVDYIYHGLSKDNDLYKITMEDGTEIKITGNHKVFTNNGWKRVDELTINDDILSISEKQLYFSKDEIKDILRQYITTKSPKIHYNYQQAKQLNMSKEEYYTYIMHLQLSENEKELYSYLNNILDNNFTCRQLYNYLYNTTGFCETCGEPLEFQSLLKGYNKCKNYEKESIDFYKNKSLKEQYKLSINLYKKYGANKYKKDEIINYLKNDKILSNIIDFSNITSIEDLYLYFHPTEKNRTVCEICGNKTPLINYCNPERAFNQFCSEKCRNEWWRDRQKYDNTSYRMSEMKKYNANKKLSERLKEKIKNGLFTPNITNSWCRSKLIIKFKYNNIIKTVKVRSCWEAMFILLNKHLDYETLRIPYINENNETHIYIVDFIDKNNKIVYEIKPLRNINKGDNPYKKKALEQWCHDNNYNYKIISDNYFQDTQFNTSLMRYMDNENFNKMINIIKRYKNFNIVFDYENKENIENR